ncbi:acylphosphatase [Planctomycetaceae bacterium]|nr:acylphosphatase [Planctomycetaceae bacterium]
MRRRLIYHGRVQGVGFRYTTRSIAHRHPVSGWVKNLPEGTVELLVEAEAAEMAGFLDEIAQRFHGHITSIDDLSPDDEPISGFSIRY